MRRAGTRTPRRRRRRPARAAPGAGPGNFVLPDAGFCHHDRPLPVGVVASWSVMSMPSASPRMIENPRWTWPSVTWVEIDGPRGRGAGSDDGDAAGEYLVDSALSADSANRARSEAGENAPPRTDFELATGRASWASSKGLRIQVVALAAANCLLIAGQPTRSRRFRRHSGARQSLPVGSLQSRSRAGQVNATGLPG